MEIIRMATNPYDATCYTGYDPETDRWFGPPGTGILLLRDLELRLNFTSQLLYAGGKWGKLLTRTDPATGNNSTYWDGIIGMLVRDEADWSLGSLTRTLARSRRVNFLTQHFHIVETLVVLPVPKKSTSNKKQYQYDSILAPFSANIWYSIFALLIIYSFSLSARYRIVRKRKFWSNFLSQSLNLLCPLLGRPNNFASPNFSALLWIFPALILSWLYAGELLSYLTVTDQLDLVSSWDDLRKRIMDKNLVLQFQKVFTAGYLSGEINHLFSAAAQNLLASCDSHESCMKNVLQSEIAVTGWIDCSRDIELIAGKLGAKIAQQASEISSADLYTMTVADSETKFEGFPFSPASKTIAKNFEPWLRNYFQLGLLSYWDEKSKSDLIAYYNSQRKIVDKIESSSQNSNSQDFTSDLGELVGSFVAYSFCLAVSLIAILTEKFYFAIRLNKIDTKNCKQ